MLQAKTAGTQPPKPWRIRKTRRHSAVTRARKIETPEQLEQRVNARCERQRSPYLEFGRPCTKEERLLFYAGLRIRLIKKAQAERLKAEKKRV